MDLIEEMLDDLRQAVGEEWYRTIILAAIAYELAGCCVGLWFLQYALSGGR